MYSTSERAERWLWGLGAGARLAGLKTLGSVKENYPGQTQERRAYLSATSSPICIGSCSVPGPPRGTTISSCSRLTSMGVYGLICIAVLDSAALSPIDELDAALRSVYYLLPRLNTVQIFSSVITLLSILKL